MKINIFGTEGYFGKCLAINSSEGSVGDTPVEYFLYEIKTVDDEFFAIVVKEPDEVAIKIVNERGDANFLFDLVSKNEVDAATLNDVIADELIGTRCCKNESFVFNIL